MIVLSHAGGSWRVRRVRDVVLQTVKLHTASKVTQMATIEYTLDQKVVSFTIDGMGAEEVRQRHVRRSFLLNQ